MAGIEWYFVSIDGTNHGPSSLAEVLDAVKSGKLKPSSLVWNENMPEWVAFQNVPELNVDAEKEKKEKEEAERKVREEKERLEAEQKAKEKKEQEEKEKKELEEREKKERAERERREAEEREKKEREERERKEREERERQEREERDRKEQEERDRKEREEREERDRKEKEARDQQEREEKTQRDEQERLENDKKAKAEAEARQKQEEEARLQKEKEDAVLALALPPPPPSPSNSAALPLPPTPGSRKISTTLPLPTPNKPPTSPTNATAAATSTPSTPTAASSAAAPASATPASAAAPAEEKKVDEKAAQEKAKQDKAKAEEDRIIQEKNTYERLRVEAAALLTKGAVLNKWKHKKCQKRMTWVSDNLENVCWGEGLDKKSSNGQLGMNEISAVQVGSTACEDQTRTFTLVAAERTLDLQCDSKEQRDLWVQAFRVLTGQYKLERNMPLVVEEVRIMLTRGAMFNKYKHKKPQKREIWCNTDLTIIYWGEDNHKKVNGSLCLTDVSAIVNGCPGSVNANCAFTLVSQDRNLELEAQGVLMKEHWMRALHFALDLIKQKRPGGAGNLLAEAKLANEQKSNPEYAAHVTVLTMGSMFLKYKHKKGQPRFIWFSSALDTIYWGEKADKKQVSGMMLVKDFQGITLGCPGSMNMACAFTLVAKDRTLELEAMTKSVADTWVKALCAVTGLSLR